MPKNHLDARQIKCLRDLVRWIDAEKVPGVIVGGMAVNILGRERATKDVDALVRVAEDSWAALIKSAEPFGFVPRVSDVLVFAAESRVILLRHVPTRVAVDVILGVLPFERDVIKRSIRKEARGISVPLPTPADLVIMKVVANRPQDLADAAGVLDKTPRASTSRIRRVVREFAAAIESPELVESLDQILRRRKKR